MIFYEFYTNMALKWVKIFKIARILLSYDKLTSVLDVDALLDIGRGVGDASTGKVIPLTIEH